MGKIIMQETTLADPEKPTLLFVDDEQNILSSLRRLFRAEGYNIFLANSGAEGLEVLRQENINLVISDMRMPEMNGAEFLEKVAKEWPKVTRILLTGYSEVSATIDAINKGNIYKYISKPWEDNDIKLTVRHALDMQKIEQERDHLLELTSKQNEELKEFNINLEGLVKSRTAELDQTMGMLEKAYETLKENYSSTIKVFSNFVGMREGALKSDSHKISEMAQKIATQMGMDEDQAQQVSYAGMLRNIGKIGFDDKLINQPFESMSQEDRKRFIKHPLIAEGVLMALDPVRSAAKIIRNYCEKYDGSGYPDKLQDKQIPLGSRILSVVSDYYALQNGMLMPGEMSAQQAVDYIKKNAGARYDPKVVEEFVKSYGDTAKSEIEKSNIQKINACDLEKGMVLAADINTKDGLTLLTKGSKLGVHIIKQINNLESILKETFEISIKR